MAAKKQTEKEDKKQEAPEEGLTGMSPEEAAAQLVENSGGRLTKEEVTERLRKERESES